jgi:uncharacterized GH25 family protein
MRKVISILLAGLVAAPALAHDFWLQPLQFSHPEPGPVPLHIYVGHGAARDRWGLPVDRVVLFRSIGPDGLIDRKPMLTLGAPGVDAVVPLAKPGTYILAFQSSPSTSDLPFLRFNDYVTQEGLTPIAANREKTGTQRTNGRELYSRRAKAIVQIGALDAAGIARVTKPIGLSLEIVPERHPSSLKPGEPLPVRIFFRGKPLAGALVKLTNLNADDKPVSTGRTDRVGRARFMLPSRGQWQFNVIWSEVLPRHATADYVTTFSSLTFGT